MSQRSPDRFAAVIAHSGSWSLGYWPVIHGTPLCTIQGVHDARAGVRWHYTDIEYGRWTDKILSRLILDHTYLEQNGNHAIAYGRPQIAAYFKSAEPLRRDPYCEHVVLASPVGFDRAYCFPVHDNRWLTLDESTPGDLDYDELRGNGSDEFDTWRLSHRIGQHRGAAIDAINRGENRIFVTTTNVARFTIWLHPKMVDIAKPVTIVVNGKTLFQDSVHPDLATALESYERLRLGTGLPDQNFAARDNRRSALI